MGRATIDRRAFLGAMSASALSLVTARARAASPRPVRMQWPWSTQPLDPYAAHDLAAALVGASVFPPLYLRAFDGVIEPRAAASTPRETDRGLYVALSQSIRSSDVVASMTAALDGAARVWLRDVPVPRVEGAHGVLFPGLVDGEALMRKLATPLAGIAQSTPHGLVATGPFEIAPADAAMVKSDPDRAQKTLILRRRAEATGRARVRPAIAVSPSPASVALRPLAAISLEGPTDLATSLRAFERGDSEIAWLGDGLATPRLGARTIDMGPLAYLAITAGAQAPALQRPGALLARIDAMPPDRLAHLGLLRRGMCVAGAEDQPRPLVAGTSPPLPPRSRVVVRDGAPICASAAEVIARELGCVVEKLDEAAFARAENDQSYAVAIDVVRAIDDTAEGCAAALAMFAKMTVAPPAGSTPVTLAATGSALFGWEIALVGAQAADVWIPRAPGGGFDLELGGEV